MNKVEPITVDQLPVEWIATRRDVLTRDKYEIRAINGIQIRKPGGEWGFLSLPGGAVYFLNAAERDGVIAQLT